jgi:hypothetical protein
MSADRLVGRRHAAGPWFRPIDVSGSDAGDAALILTVGNEERVDAWRWPAAQDQSGTTVLDADFQSAQQDACQAASLVPPLQPRDLHSAGGLRGMQWILASLSGLPPQVVRGRSGGLAMALSMVAQRTGLTLPDDFVAIAEVAPSGQCQPAAIGHKLSVLLKFPHRISRVLVAPNTRNNDGQYSGLRFKEVATLEAAVEELWGSEWRERALQRQPIQRVASAWWLLVSDGYRAGSNWQALAQFARTARVLWADKTPWQVHFAGMIGERHAGAATGSIDADFDLVLRLPNDEMKALARAQFLQQSTDFASPLPAELECSLSVYTQFQAQSVAEAGLYGAMGRHWAVRNPADVQSILDCLLRGIQWYRDAHQEKQISHNLAAALRLGGATGHEKLSELLEDAANFIQHLGDPQSKYFVREARVAGMTLAATNDRQAVGYLNEALGRPEVEQVPHATYSLYRHGITLHTRHGDLKEAARLRQQLEAAATNGSYAKWWLHLADMDAALRNHETHSAVVALQALADGKAQALHWLIKDRSLTDMDTVRHVARYYPY